MALLQKWAIPVGVGLVLLVIAVQLILIGQLEVSDVYVDAASTVAKAKPAPAAEQKKATAPPSVIDGDSLEWQGTQVRLFGIDAFELEQRCKTTRGFEYGCGYEARATLVKFIAGKTIRCDRKDTDVYGRMVAVCTADGKDIGKEMVKQGLALAYLRFSKDYVADERYARAHKIGAWAGSFDTPWEWRDAHPDSAKRRR